MQVVDGVEMVDVREAAALAGRTPETVRRWVWAGRLAAQRRGNRLLLPREAVIRLATGNGGKTAAEAAMSLTAWAQEVERTLAGGRAGVSAAELVLADRAARDGNHAGP